MTLFRDPHRDASHTQWLHHYGFELRRPLQNVSVMTNPIFRRLSAALFGATALATAPTASADNTHVIAWVVKDTPMSAEINDAFSRIMYADQDMGRAVVDLESATDKAGRPWDAAQLLATSYEVVGRYADARQIRNAHRKKVPQCIYTGRTWPDGLADLPASVRVLLINEDHLDATTRANLVSGLPQLRKMGFTALAMEAIPDTFVQNLIQSGDVPDDARSGTYLRDPISALLIRRAAELGFQLVAYDTPDGADTRDVNQANRISSIIKKIEGKLVVFTGPGHVQMEGRWMGRYLEKLLGEAMYTIDQTSNAGADCDDVDLPTLTIRDRKRPSHLLGMKTDAVLVTPSPPTGVLERSLPNSWLALGGLRLPIFVSTKELCPGMPKRCLIEARRKNDLVRAVPYDRYLSEGAWHGYLFVPPGHYTVSGMNENGSRMSIDMTVAP